MIEVDVIMMMIMGWDCDCKHHIHSCCCNRTNIVCSVYCNVLLYEYVYK